MKSIFAPTPSLPLTCSQQADVRFLLRVKIVHPLNVLHAGIGAEKPCVSAIPGKNARSVRCPIQGPHMTADPHLQCTHNPLHRLHASAAGVMAMFTIAYAHQA